MIPTTHKDKDVLVVPKSIGCS